MDTLFFDGYRRDRFLAFVANYSLTHIDYKKYWHIIVIIIYISIVQVYQSLQVY